MEKLRLNRIGQSTKLPGKLYAFEPTHASRYWILAGILSALGATKSSATVLDVGGKKGLLRFFPGFSPTIIDMEESDEPKFVQGDALHMPFKDGQFTYAVSCDVLEHIPAKDRAAFLLEMLRVSKEGVILCAPFDNPGNGELEVEMNDYYAHLTGQQHRWLREHIDNGLPSEQEVERVLHSKGYGFAKFRHFSPQAWRTVVPRHLLHAAFGDNPRLDTTVHAIYKEYYDTFCSKDFSDDGYRTFFVIGKKSTPIVELPSLEDTQKARADFYAVCEKLTLELVESELQERRMAVRQTAKQHAKLNADLHAAKQALEAARAELQTVKASRMWRAGRRLRSVANRANIIKKRNV